MKDQVIGILGAMIEEVAGVIELLNNRTEKYYGGRTFYSGEYSGCKVVVSLSKWGKVSAATTVATMILKFEVSKIIFTGVAGAINSDLRIGDIIIGKRTIQCDMDGRPLVPQYVIPSLNKDFMNCDPTLLAISSGAINELIGKNVFEKEEFKVLHIESPRLFIGDIASSDRFFSNQEDKNQLHSALPSVLCVEMEGGAVAQVCEEYKIPWVVIRIISDNADDTSSVDFQSFVDKIASRYSSAIVECMLKDEFL